MLSSKCKGYDSQVLGQHHEKVMILGEGTYGAVFKCLNVKTQKMEAVKVIHRHKEDIGGQEIYMLKQLRCLDPDRCNLVRFNSHFFHEEASCLSFELLDINLSDYMSFKKCQSVHRGLPLSEVKVIMDQMAIALLALKSVGIIHADIKPPNVMIVDRHQQPIKVKLGDFGGSQFTSELDPNNLVHTCTYSPLELLLDSVYNEAVDVWSLGVTSLELALGVNPFRQKDRYDILRCIVNISGQPPDHVLDRGRRTRCFFKRDINNQQQWIMKTKEEYIWESNRLTSSNPYAFQCLGDIELDLLLNSENQGGLSLFLDLIQRMLDTDPERRITPLEILQHPFFHGTETKSKEAPEVDYQCDSISSGEEDEDLDIGNWGQFKGLEFKKTKVPSESPNDFYSLNAAILQEPQENDKDTLLENWREVELEKHEVQVGLPADIHLPSPVYDNPTQNDEEAPLEISREVHLDNHVVQLDIPADIHLPTPLYQNLKEKHEDILLEIPGKVHLDTREVQPCTDLISTKEDNSKDVGRFRSICRHVRENARFYGGALVLAAAAYSVVMLIRSKS